MADNEIPLEITVDSSQASKSLNDFEKQAKSATDSIEKSFQTLKTVALAAVAVIAGREILHGIESIVSAASESDAAVRKLGVSMATTGEFSDEAVKSFEEFASAIQKTTTLTDEAVLGGVSLAKSFGLTNDQAKNLTKAAIDLAAATGKDLDTAVHELGNTFSGTAGRLSKLAPELKNLSEEELRNGAAIDILSKKFKGFAEASAQTFGGAIIQTKNAFGEIFESLGKVITQNPVVLKVIQELGKAFNAIAEIVDKNRDSISEFLSKALKKIISFIPTVIKVINILVQGFFGLINILGDVVGGFAELGKIFVRVTRPIQEFYVLIGKTLVSAIAGFLGDVVKVAKAIPGIGTAFKALGINLDDVSATFDELQKSADAVDVSKTVDEFDQLATDSLAAVQEFTDNAQTTVKGVAEFSGNALVKLEGFAENTSQSIDKVKNSSVKATTGIKNMSHAIDDSATRAALLKTVAGSFDKLKSSIDEVRKSVEKQTLSVREQITAEYNKGKLLEANAATELALKHELNDANLKILNDYDALIEKQKELATNSLTIGTLKFREVAVGLEETLSNLADGLSNLQDVSIDSSSLIDLGTNVAEGFIDSAKSGIKDLATKFGELTLSEIAGGIGDAVSGAAEVFAGIVSGQLVQDGFTFAQAFADFPKTLLNVFSNFNTIIQGIVKELPNVISTLIDHLPEIATSIANAISDVLTKILDRLPEILDSILSALGTLVEKLFSDIIPRLIAALPGVIKKILEALPGILQSILNSLPTIITEIFKAIPQIIKAIIDALPAIVEVLLEAMPDIVLAFVEGLITAIPEIIDALITSLLIDGGLERIIKAIIRAIPRIALALVQGILRGLANGVVQIGQTIGKGFTAAISNIGSKIGGDFGASIGPFFQNIFSQLGNVFTNLFSGFFSGLSNAFQQGAAGIFQNIISAFVTAGQNLISAIGSALSGVYDSVRNGIVEGANSVRDKIVEGAQSIRDKIVEAFTKLRDDIFGPIADAFGKLLAPINDLVSAIKGFNPFGGGDSGGGGNGTVNKVVSGGKSVLKSVGLAKGGMIKPIYAAKGLFAPKGTDTVPSVLTPGELVVSKNETTKLSKFLDGQEKGSSNDGFAALATLLAQISQKLDAPMQTTATATVDGRAFANIILDLNRNNARLSA